MSKVRIQNKIARDLNIHVNKSIKFTSALQGELKVREGFMANQDENDVTQMACPNRGTLGRLVPGPWQLRSRSTPDEREPYEQQDHRGVDWAHDTTSELFYGETATARAGGSAQLKFSAHQSFPSDMGYREISHEN
jgi:hypothetical protein